MVLPTLLLTRPMQSAQAFAAALDPSVVSSVRLVIAPLIKIVTLDFLPTLDGVGGVIFTSVNGVASAPEGLGRIAFCVGAETTKQANARGWNAQMVGANARELIKTLCDLRPKSPLLHLGGEHTVGDIAQSLTSEGIETRHVALYQQQLLPLGHAGLAALKGPAIVPVFSTRTAQNLVNEAKGNFDSAHVIALSEAVAAPFDGEKLAQRVILSSPKVIYMRKAVENLCLTLSLP